MPDFGHAVSEEVECPLILIRVFGRIIEGDHAFLFGGPLFDHVGYGTDGTKKARRHEGTEQRKGPEGRGLGAWVSGGHSVVKERGGRQRGNEAFRPSGASRRPVEGL